MWFVNYTLESNAMTEESVQMIYDMSADRIRETETSFHRYLFAEIEDRKSVV